VKGHPITNGQILADFVATSTGNGKILEIPDKNPSFSQRTFQKGRRN
jgi:uncharacterized GH25 family protein